MKIQTVRSRLNRCLYYAEACVIRVIPTGLNYSTSFEKCRRDGDVLTASTLCPINFAVTVKF